MRLTRTAVRVALVTSLWLVTGVSGGAASERPNFVWIVSEDNSKHFLELYDGTGAPTPNIERLAEEGIVFEHAFSNSPVCSVARTTLITGVYAPRLGTQYHRPTKEVTLPEGWRMFPAFLREAGYYTANNRKKDYNAREGEGVWDESSGQASWQNRPSAETPFFHFQTYTHSHESSLHFGEDWLEQGVTETDPASVDLFPYHPETRTFRRTYARYYDRIMKSDDLVGQMVERLKEAGELKEAIRSENPWVRYWAMTDCAVFGERAAPLADEAISLLEDENLLVRVRAAEFVGRIQARDPRPILKRVLREAEDPVVSLIALNAVVYLQDGPPSHPFEIESDEVSAVNGQVRRRLRYLSE